MKGRQRLLIGIVVVLVLVAGLIAGIYFSSRPSEPAEVDFTNVKAQMDTGEYQAARAALEDIVVADPDNAEAHFLLGLTYFNLENYALAQQHFEKSMALDPNRAAAVHHNLGVLAYQTGNVQRALEEFQSALEIDPDDPDTHYQLGATYLVMAFPMGASEPDPELLQKAASEFQRALDLAPDKAEALVGLGNVYMLQANFSEAITVLKQAVEINPDMREALFALGRAYVQAGEIELARETLQRFLKTDPPAVWAEQAQDILEQLEP
jgi:tetratricopeptide (TPR) repeat protein